MVTHSASSKRPICPSCSKPTRTCLCNRFKTSKIDNSVSITILQHSLEKNHPLNSARIAALGLKNVEIVSVSDVNFQANFSIRVLDPNPEMGTGYIGQRLDFYEKDVNFRVLGPDPEMGTGYIGKRFDFYEKDRIFGEFTKNHGDFEGKVRLSNDFEGQKRGENCLVSDHLAEKSGSCTLEVQECVGNGEPLLEGIDSRRSEEATIDFDGKVRLSNVFEGQKREENCLVSDHLAEKSGSCTLEVQECVGNGEPLLEGIDSRRSEEATIDFDGKVRLSNVFEGRKNGENCLVNAHLAEKSGSCTLEVQECVENGESLLEGMDSRSNEEAAIDFRIEKYGVVSSFRHCWMAKDQLKELSFEKLMGFKETGDNLARGFVVKKLQRKQINGSFSDEESEEFEIAIPQGSVLLFPSEKAVGISDLQCEVKNLIVLDGTWSKARRMYNENPWLKALPHLKLDVDKMSLYDEVRQQPKAGYLSTIESIVYSLKAVGHDCEGLDGLLDVFESMVGDQRRFKDERLNEESTT